MKTKEIVKPQAERINEASESLKEILKQIEPFIKPTKVGGVSTQGKWEASSTTTTTVFTRDVFHNALKKISRPLKKGELEKKET